MGEEEGVGVHEATDGDGEAAISVLSCWGRSSQGRRGRGRRIRVSEWPRRGGTDEPSRNVRLLEGVHDYSKVHGVKNTTLCGIGSAECILRGLASQKKLL